VSRVIETPGIRSNCNGIAVSRDGSMLLVADSDGGSHAIHEFSMLDGSRRRVVGSKGRRPLQFNCPKQVWVAADGFVFVADSGNSRVQVLTPLLPLLHRRRQLRGVEGVCASDTHVVVAQRASWCPVLLVAVFNRADGALLRRFGPRGSGDGELIFRSDCASCLATVTSQLLTTTTTV
jgi:hypothetical protein